MLIWKEQETEATKMKKEEVEGGRDVKSAAHVPSPRACTHLYRYQSSEIFTPTRTIPVKQQGDGAGETSIMTNYYELQGTCRATRAPAAQTLQSVRQTCPCTMATCLLYTFVRFPFPLSTCSRVIPTHVPLHVWYKCVHMYVYVHVCMYRYMYIYVCMYVCMCTHIFYICMYLFSTLKTKVSF